MHIRTAEIWHPVRHDTRIKSLPRAILGHDPFSASRLLGRSAHDHEGPGESPSPHNGLDADSRGHGARRNQIVATSVSHTRECVFHGSIPLAIRRVSTSDRSVSFVLTILCIETHCTASFPDREASLKGRLYTVDAALDAPSPPLEKVREQLTRFRLLEENLGIVVDLSSISCQS